MFVIEAFFSFVVLHTKCYDCSFVFRKVTVIRGYDAAIEEHCYFSLRAAYWPKLLFITMSPNLDRLPFDVVFSVAEHLSLEDVVHLGRTCKQLGSILLEETLCRRIAEVRAPVRIIATL